MSRAAIAVAVLLAVALVGPAVADEWDDFVAKYNKKWGTREEYEYRRNVFWKNMKRVSELNANERKHGGEACYNVTMFMDMSAQEFSDSYLNAKRSDVTKGRHVYGEVDEAFLSSGNIDWVSKGVVTPVKNQGQCGSCWAFSATEGVESAYALAGNPLTAFSTQQTTACTQACGGCGGGNLAPAWEYLEQAGMESAAAYPYTAGSGYTGNCDYNSADVVTQVTGYNWVATSGDPSNLLSGLQSSPVSVCVDASSWQYYSGGVLSQCGYQIDHCVQLTGYQSNYNGQQVWVVRNSWTANWGEQGFIYLAYGDTCAIAQNAGVPTV